MLEMGARYSRSALTLPQQEGCPHRHPQTVGRLPPLVASRGLGSGWVGGMVRDVRQGRALSDMCRGLAGFKKICVKGGGGHNKATKATSINILSQSIWQQEYKLHWHPYITLPTAP